MVRGLDVRFLEELYPALSKSLTDIDLVVPHQSSKVGLLLLHRGRKFLLVGTGACLSLGGLVMTY